MRSLRKQWKQLDSPTTVYTLEQIVRIYGVEPAALATQAIIQELEARVKNPIIQAQFAREIRNQMEVDEHS